MEIEIKYAPVSYETFAKIALDLGLENEETVGMAADYLDTTDGYLSQNKISVRNRGENGVSVYTMKCSLNNIEGIAVREEEEIATEDISVAFDHFAKNERLAQIVENIRQRQLVSIAKMEFVRKKYTVDIPGATVEISHDTGKMWGKNGGEGEILEMEIELKKGDEKAFALFLMSLEKYDLTIEKRSKLHRAKML